MNTLIDTPTRLLGVWVFYGLARAVLRFDLLAEPLTTRAHPRG